MRLKLENFAKIKEADIALDGITVIGGDNNTGKSTIGKVLFGMFYSLLNIEEQIQSERERAIGNICEYALYSLCARDTQRIEIGGLKSAIGNYVLPKVLDIVHENGNDKALTLEGIKSVLLEFMSYGTNNDIDISEKQNELKEEMEKIKNCLDISDEIFAQEYITRCFSRIFHSQVNSLVNAECDSVVELVIKCQMTKLNFVNNKCSDYVRNIPLLKKAVYIDNPFIIDDFSCKNSSGIMENDLKKLLVSDSQDEISVGLINSILAKEKLNEIYEAMNSVVKGDIVEEKKNEFYLKNDEFSSPVSFQNLSAGLKSFVILKMLLENGSLQPKDVLILDEPEIHLHPEWQLAYAELIVLLQKHFDLEIVITTHSPYFLDAINLFSIKHKIASKVNYYLSSMEENQVTFQRVTDNIEAIYEKMALPTQTLDTLRYQLFNN